MHNTVEQILNVPNQLHRLGHHIHGVHYSNHAIEIAMLPLKPGINVLDKTSEAGKTFDKCLHTLREQEGFRRVYYGYRLENDTDLDFLVNWESVHDHEAFMKSPAYQPFCDSLASILRKPVRHIFHVHPSFWPPNAIVNAPVTEMLELYGCENSVLGNVKQFVAGLHGTDGFRHAVWGESVEDDVVPGINEGNKGKAVVLWVGWESKQKHEEWKKSEHAEKYLHLIREGRKEVEMHHSKFHEFE